MSSNKNSKFTNFLVERDAFGHGVGVNYRGSESYQTKVGAFCTIATLVLVIFNTATLSTAFFDGSRQDEKAQSTTFDLFDTDTFNFEENSFEVALYVDPPIDPRIGWLKVV